MYTKICDVEDGTCLIISGSDGTIKYENVPNGRHVLRIVAVTPNKERDVIRRRIYIGM